MGLGDKLKATLSELEAARIEGIEAQAAADMERIRKEREEIQSFVDKLKSYIIHTIEDGKVPSRRVEDYSRQQWLRSAEKGKAAFQDIWTQLRSEFGREKIGIKLVEGHDGVGIKSWITVTVVPLDHPTVFRVKSGKLEPHATGPARWRGT